MLYLQVSFPNFIHPLGGLNHFFTIYVVSFGYGKRG